MSTPQMRMTRNQPDEEGYAYYPQLHKKSGDKKAAIALGKRRQSPSLRDLDYLVLRTRVEIISKWLTELPQEPLLVIDIGGRIQPYCELFPRVERYVAVDLVFEGLVDVIGDAGAIPMKDETCDVVLCTQTLDYVAEPKGAISEMCRILKPGGILILSAPAFVPQHHDECWRFTAQGLKQLLSGFSEVEIVPECFSAAGLARSLNCLLHSRISRYRAQRLAEVSSIPLINAIGSVLDRLAPHDERCTANYCARAIKASATAGQ